MQAIFRNIGSLGVAVAVLGGVANYAIYTVPAGARSIIFDRFSGVKNEVIGEGTHFLIPWVQRPIIFDIRTRPRNIPVTTGSKDLQTVNITLRILYRPRSEFLSQIYTNLGIDFEERVLPSITNEVLKAIVAQFDASDLITQREVVSRKVNETLTERATSFGIILDDISLTHLTFGREFSEAVEAKQVAQQEAERARYAVEKAEQLKAAAIISAEGDSEAAALLAKAFASSGEGLIEMRRIEASEDIAYLLSRNRNINFLPNSTNALLNLPPN